MDVTNHRGESPIIVKEAKRATNIFYYSIGSNGTTGLDEFKHPAVFPLQLASDQIYSWSNEGDIIYDCCGGSMTSAVAAHKLNRKWIMSEVSEEYCELGRLRLEPYLAQASLFTTGG